MKQKEHNQGCVCCVIQVNDHCRAENNLGSHTKLHPDSLRMPLAQTLDDKTLEIGSLCSLKQSTNRLILKNSICKGTWDLLCCERGNTNQPQSQHREDTPVQLYTTGDKCGRGRPHNQMGNCSTSTTSV